MNLVDTGIKIIEVRIRNFRSLKEVNINLDWLTILIGENNSGKTNFLDALNIAIGSVRHSYSADDVFLDYKEKYPPKNREITIDILIKPTDDNGKIIDKFPGSGFWISHFGIGISLDEHDKDYVGIRAIIKYDETRSEYVLERKFISNWQNDPTKWNEAKINQKASVYSSVIEPFALHFLDAKRDIKEEIRTPGSFWNKLVSNPGFSEKNIDAFEKTLQQINTEILTGSKVLNHIQQQLNDIYKSIGCDKDAVTITPVPRHIRDLTNSVNINLATKKSQTFSLDKHGMGTRSIATVLIFRAYSEWRRKNSRETKIHAFLAIEEPEAHLHPQAQRALYKQIEQIPGQRIVSTHSSYLVGHVEIINFRCFRKEGAATSVSWIKPGEIENDDLIKINRFVMSSKGELVFSRVLIFCEGTQTEDQVLTVFAEKFWNIHPNALGITIIPVSGTNYSPFIQIAKKFCIPWYILSDGEEIIVRNVKSTLRNLGEPAENPYLFIIPENKNFEQYIAIEPYRQVLIDMIIRLDGKNEKHKEALTREWAGKGNQLEEILKYLRANKPRCAKPLAEAISNMPDPNLNIPKVINDLFTKIKEDLKIEKVE